MPNDQGELRTVTSEAVKGLSGVAQGRTAEITIALPKGRTLPGALALLKDNGLVEVEDIMRSTARLVVNRASQKTKYEPIMQLINRLRAYLS